MREEVPEVGLEPTQPEGHWILNPARLPFRHSGVGLNGSRPPRLPAIARQGGVRAWIASQRLADVLRESSVGGGSSPDVHDLSAGRSQVHSGGVGAGIARNDNNGPIGGPLLWESGVSDNTGTPWVPILHQAAIVMASSTRLLAHSLGKRAGRALLLLDRLFFTPYVSVETVRDELGWPYQQRERRCAGAVRTRNPSGDHRETAWASLQV